MNSKLKSAEKFQSPFQKDKNELVTLVSESCLLNSWEWLGGKNLLFSATLERKNLLPTGSNVSLLR